MSLINDALKKAQKMRHEENLAAASNAAGEAPRTGARSRVSPGMIALISGGTALAVCAVVLAGIVLMRGSHTGTPPSSETVQPASATVREAPAVATPAVATAPIQAQPQPSPTPVAKPAAGNTAEAGPLIALPASVASKPAATEPTPGPTPAAAPAPAVQDKPASAQPAPVFVFSQPEPDHSKPNPAAQRFVDRIRLTGIRKTASGAKVMMNEKVYRINDVVDQTLGLRLTEAEADKLVFTDEYGHRYIRNFLP